MDINDKEKLKDLFNFTSNISGDCPADILPVANDCSGTNTIENCVMCWREALADRIKQLTDNEKGK